MDIEKLIERLRTESLYADKASLEIMDLCMEAATALSTLQAENKRLNKIVCSIPTTPDSGRTVSQYDKEMSMCVYLDDLEAENEKLRETVDKYATAARVIALHLKPFCDESLPYDEMIADAARKASDELEQVKRERDAVVESIPHECKTCVYHTVFFNGCTLDHDCTNPDGGCSNNYDRWRWRGRKED